MSNSIFFEDAPFIIFKQASCSNISVPRIMNLICSLFLLARERFRIFSCVLPVSEQGITVHAGKTRGHLESCQRQLVSPLRVPYQQLVIKLNIRPADIFILELSSSRSGVSFILLCAWLLSIFTILHILNVFRIILFWLWLLLLSFI